MIKQIQFQGRDSEGNVFCQPIPSNSYGGLEKTASEAWKGSNLHPTVRKYLKSHLKKTDEGVYVLVNALGASEFWGSNVNGDAFPEEALIHSPDGWEDMTPDQMRAASKSWKYGFPTFMHAHPFKHHVNKDPNRAFGRVELAVWNPKMHRVELVVYLDRKLAEKHGAMDVIQRVEKGEFPDVSMGCKVPYDRCSICDKKAKTKKDYCDHALKEMNRIMPDGRKVCVINDFPKFFDISFVFIGADKSAKMLLKLAHREDGAQCMGDFCAMPKLSADVGSLFSRNEKDDFQFDPLDAVRQTILDSRMSKVASQKVANDPIKKKYEVQGVPVWIEWPRGSLREYKSPKGKVVHYSKKMQADYGYIPGTKDADGEEIDVYVGPDRTATVAWVVKQNKEDGKTFDENKVMLGYGSKAKARSAYEYHMGDAKERFAGMEPLPVKSLRILFADNGDGSGKQASACSCNGVCAPCSQNDFTKLAEAFGAKNASQSKASAITKDVPAGPFRKAHLPHLTRSEEKLPKTVLKKMAELEIDEALSTSAMMGIVLKPEEFQHVMLTKIGEANLADQLDEHGIVFAISDSADDTFKVGLHKVSSDLKAELLHFIPARSVASPVLVKRAFVEHTQQFSVSSPVAGDALLDQISELYNGYRQDLVKKAAVIEHSLVSDSLLSSAVAEGSVVKAFAGGIAKTANEARVLGPESLAYLDGAHYEVPTA